MPDQEDPFKKYGGKQIDEPQDPFKKYGGQAIAEPPKKKVSSLLSGVVSQAGNGLLNGGGGGVKKVEYPDTLPENEWDRKRAEREKYFSDTINQEELQKDPLKTLNKAIFSEAIGKEINKKPVFESTGQKYLSPEIKVNEENINVHNQAILQDNLKANIFPTTQSARERLFSEGRNGAADPNNETDLLAEDVIREHEKVKAILNLHRGDIKNAAIEYYANQDPRVAEIFKAGGTPPPETVGALVGNFLRDKNVIELSQESEEVNNAYREAQFNFRKDYPEMFTNEIVQKIAQGREDYGENNPFINLVGVNSSDRVMQKLYADGKVDDEEMEHYEKTVRPQLALHLKRIQTTGFAENAFQSAEKGAADIPKGLYDLTGIHNAITTKADRAYDELSEEANFTHVTPKTFGGTIATATGHLGGLLLPLGAGTKALAASKIMNAKTANEVMMGLTFYHDLYKDAEKNNPNGGYLNQLQALVQTTIFAKINPTFGALSKGVVTKAAPQIKDVLEKLKTGSITGNQAKEGMVQAILTQVPKKTLKTSGEMMLATGVSDAVGAVFSGKYDGEQSVSNMVHTFESMLLGTPLLNLASVRSNRRVMEEYLNDMGDNPTRYREQITKLAETDPKIKEQLPELLKNLTHVEVVKKELDAREDIKPSEKKKYLLLSLQEKLLKEKADAIPDEGLKPEKQLKEIEIEKKMALDPDMGSKKFLEEMYEYELIPESDRVLLENNETGKFEPNKVGEYLKYIAQQANGLTEDWKPAKGGKPTMEKYPPTLLEAANERWAKEIEKALPKEEPISDLGFDPETNQPTSEAKAEPPVSGGEGGDVVRDKSKDVDYGDESWTNTGIVFFKDKNGASKFNGKDGNEYEIREFADGDSVTVSAHDKDGKLVSSATFTKDSEGSYSASEVSSDIPSIGLARALYDYVDNKFGQVVKSASLSGEGMELWNRNNEFKYSQPKKQSTKVEEQGGGLEAGKSEIATQNIENQPPEPPKPPEGAEVGSGGELPERRFTKQMLRDEEMLGKEEIAKTLNYVRQTNDMSVKEASEILNKVGVDEAKDLVINDGDVKPAVRVVLAQMVIKKYNELAKIASETESEAHRYFYLDKAIQTATFVTEKLATEPGQMIQAFSLWSRLSPEGQLRAANQDMARQGKEKVRRREKDIKVISDKFQKANEEAANEVVESKEVKDTVQKDTNEKIAKSKDKIAKIREKRAAIIKNAKNSRGNLYSVGRLTAEGVKFVGEIAKTYIEEGVANLEILVQKVVAHIEEVAGKKATDEIKKQIQEEADKTFDQADKSFLGKVLKDKNVRISEIVKKHYTVVEKTKKSLAQKLMDDADMSQSNAQELAKKVEAAFDRVATRKKRNILYNEKARFEKIHNTLKDFKKPDPKTIQDEIIKYSNLGAFEGGEFLDMVSEKFGVGKIQPDQAAKLMQLAEKVQNAAEGSPKNDATEDLLAYRAKLRGNDLGETAQAVWYANTLSGYKTHEKNLISTFFQSMGEIGTEMAKDPKAIPYLVAGYLNGTFRRGLTEAKHTLATGRSPIHIKKVETPNVLERKQFKGGGYNPGNWFKYVMRFMVASDVLSFQGLKEARARQLARRIAGEEGFNTWSKKGWDRVNEILFHTKERWREAELQAEEEGLNGSAKKRRIYEIMESSRPVKMTEDAYGFAAKGTFNHLSEGSLGALTNAIAGGLDAVSVGGVKPLRFIVPFTRIITNVVNNSLDYTPVGLVRAARGVRGFRAFEGNQVTKSAYKELSREERKRLIAKAAIGITLTATLQALHIAGVVTITGAGPDDPEKRRQLMQEGWQPYSIKVGNRWYSYQYTPLVFMTGFLGNMNDAGEYAKEGENPDFWKKMQIASSRVAGQVVDMTWINSASTFLGALSESNPASQEKKLSQAFAGMARGVVPFSGAINQTSQAVQSIWGMPQKQVNNAWQALIADIPIARNSLNDKINALGDPVVRDIDVITSKETEDPVWKYLLDHKGWVAPVNKGTIIIYDKDKNTERPITDDEYYEFSKMRGQEIKKGIKMIMDSQQIPVMRDGQVQQVSGKDLKENELNQILSKLEGMATKYTKEMLFNKPEKNEEKEESIKEYNKMVKELLGELELDVENE